MAEETDFFGEPVSQSSVNVKPRLNGASREVRELDNSRERHEDEPPPIRINRSPTQFPAGRTPPFSIEAEEYLLSCCLLDGNDVVAKCLEQKLPVKAFYSPANQLVYEKLIDMFNRSIAIDLTMLAEELKASKQFDEIGGYAFLMQISGRIPTTAQVNYFIEKLMELYTLRELIKTSTGIVEGCYNYQGDLREFIDKSERDFFAVTHGHVADTVKQCGGAAKQAATAINAAIIAKGALTGVASGFADLDRYTFGFQKQEMIVLAARPSMGKTALALNFSEAALFPRRGPVVPTLFFSLEMSAQQLMLRLICSRSRVNYSQLRQGLVSRTGEEMQRVLIATDEFSRAPLFIDDSSSPTIMELRAKARRVHRKTPIGMIVVDYLQLMSATDSKMPREQQVSEMSRGLKGIAKDLDVPVIVLSQLNRASETEKRQPKLSDLRESGSIEQDADVVLMLARPKDLDDDSQVAGDSADLLVAKQRNGPVGELKLTFLRNITRFENYTT